MVCLLNEEIRAIQCTISHMRRGMALETNQRKQLKMKKDIKELEELLNKKLGEDNNYEY